jgi:hypothetical protein
MGWAILQQQEPVEEAIREIVSTAEICLVSQSDEAKEYEQVDAAPIEEPEHLQVATCEPNVAAFSTKTDAFKAALAAALACPLPQHLPDSGVGLTDEEVDNALIDESENMLVRPGSYRTYWPSWQLTFAEQMSALS